MPAATKGALTERAASVNPSRGLAFFRALASIVLLTQEEQAASVNPSRAGRRLRLLILDAAFTTVGYLCASSQRLV